MGSLGRFCVAENQHKIIQIRKCAPAPNGHLLFISIVVVLVEFGPHRVYDPPVSEPNLGNYSHLENIITNLNFRMWIKIIWNLLFQYLIIGTMRSASVCNGKGIRQ